MVWSMLHPFCDFKMATPILIMPHPPKWCTPFWGNVPFSTNCHGMLHWTECSPGLVTLKLTNLERLKSGWLGPSPWAAGQPAQRSCSPSAEPISCCGHWPLAAAACWLVQPLAPAACCSAWSWSLKEQGLRDKGGQNGAGVSNSFHGGPSVSWFVPYLWNMSN